MYVQLHRMLGQRLARDVPMPCKTGSRERLKNADSHFTRGAQRRPCKLNVFAAPGTVSAFIEHRMPGSDLKARMYLDLTLGYESRMQEHRSLNRVF